jgi:glutamate/tyrosine decarboxylase-like PLP-dependent enzyme
MDEQPHTLRTHGVSADEVQAELDRLYGQDPIIFASLKGPLDAQAVAQAAHQQFFSSNAMLAGRLPAIAQMQNDLYGWALGLMHGGPDARASMTTGGSESIFCAVHALREWGREKLPQITRPELVVPYSAHAGFSKACHYMNITLVRVPLGPDRRADVAAMQAAITPNTIGLVGSAPCWPYGLYDPIRELGALAQARGLWLHVDACVGGFLAPFVSKLGYTLPDWDLSVPGVCSISADLHKYGFAPLHCSMVLYASADLHAYQPHVVEDWPTGPYRTETVVGSRSGASVAGAWAVMRYLGEEGYLTSTRRIIELKERLTAAVNEIPGLYALENDLQPVAVGADGRSARTTPAGAAGQRERGWLTLGTLDPPLMNLPLGADRTDAEMEAFLSALEEIAASAAHVETEGALNYAS